MNEDLRETLRREYCPPLDDAIFYAIFDDYRDQSDLITKEQLDAIRKTFDSLKTSAVAEDTVEFDPSGTGGIVTNGESRGVTDTTSSSEQASNFYDAQTLSTGISELLVESGIEARNAGDSNWTSLNQEQKKDALVEMFPSMNHLTILNTIRNNKSDLKSCVDTLLNLSFMSQNDPESETSGPILKKGIEGFASDELSHRGRKRKGKKKGFLDTSTRSSSTASATDAPSTPIRNAWRSTDEDVTFLVERTNLSEKAVRSIYHKAGTSLSLTIKNLAEQEAKTIKHPEDLNTVTQVKIAKLHNEFPSISTLELAGLLSMAHDALSAAQQLANAMIRDGASVSPSQIKLVPQYARPKLEDDANSPAPKSPTPYTYVDKGRASNLAAAHGEAGQEAFAQASAAAKRGRSDHFMKSAAVVYAERGHEHRAQQRGLESDVATVHVAQQSTQDMTDLHGTRVHDAVRIAKERTWQWWDGLGDAKFIGDGGPANRGFRIVTGVGHHNIDGASRLGPAVWKALVSEGWKASVGTGEILITGRKRR
ncbi:MAG: hypothetical protein Q9160_002084 [Pyrenula sp. 1 TL-2023]